MGKTDTNKKKSFLLWTVVMLVCVLNLTVLTHAEAHDPNLVFASFNYNKMWFIEYGAREAIFTGCDSSFDSESVPVPETVLDEAGNIRTVVGIGGTFNSVDIGVPQTVRFCYNAASEKLRSIHFLDIPDLTIEDDAFSGSENLITVNFNPNGKLTVGEDAFYECQGLTRLSFPANSDIDEYAVNRCYNLKEIVNAPAKLSFFPGNSDEDYHLQKITFAPGLKTIEGIRGELESIQTIIIQEGTLEIGDSAFYRLTGLTSVTLPEGIKTVDGFWGCTNLQSINLPDSITTIESCAFADCTSLTGITRLPSSIEYVGDSAFEGCKNLRMSVNHPGNLEYQYRNSGITDITINIHQDDPFHILYPGGLTGCPNLTNITVKGTTDFKSVNGALYVPVYDYGIRSGWSLAKYPAGKSSGGKYTVPADVIGIGAFAFEGCHFSEIHIPATVQYVFDMDDYMDGDPYPAFYGMASSPTVYYVKNSYIDPWINEVYSKTKAEYGATVNITYVLNGGQNAATNPSSFTAGETIELAAPKRSGYEFAGWQQEVDGVYKAVKNNTVTPSDGQLVDGLKLSAKWNKVSDPASGTKALKVGETGKVSGNTYKVTKAVKGTTSGTVTLITARNAKSVSVPKTVKLSDGRTYKVTTVGKEAFKAKKIRTVTIGANVKKLSSGAFSGSRATTIVLKTKGLTKASVKGSLKQSKVKTIQVKVGKKADNKKYIAKYKPFFKKNNSGASVKVK